MTHLCGVILDIDGTLVNSNGEHARAWVEALAEFGYTIPYDKVFGLIGMGGDNLIEALDMDIGADVGAQIGHRRGEIFKSRYLPTLEAFPQTRELLMRMRERGLKLAVATSAKGDEAAPLLKLTGADMLIEEKTTSSDAEHSKPDPDIIQAALEKLDCSPEQVVMLGDTEWDIEAAHKAGIRTIALRSGGRDDTALVGALAIYNDPADLLAHYDQSPLANGLLA